MRTEVKICFDSNDAPGGALTILGPAGCGPDVATVDATPVLGRVDAWVRLDAADPRLQLLLNLLTKHGIRWWEERKDIHSAEELESARLLAMRTRPAHEVFGGPRVGTTYSLENACKVCGAGARQTSALMIKGDDLPRLEGVGAAATYYNDILVDEQLAHALENSGAKGISFRGVYAVMSDKRQVRLRWRQMCSEHVLPALSPRSTGIELRDGCSSCGRSGYFTQLSVPARFIYRSADIVSIQDVNTTWEHFGDWDFDGDVSEALWAYPWVLVTPKVWRVFRDAGVTSFDWLPIRVEDA